MYSKYLDYNYSIISSQKLHHKSLRSFTSLIPSFKYYNIPLTQTITWPEKSEFKTVKTNEKKAFTKSQR